MPTAGGAWEKAEQEAAGGAREQKCGLQVGAAAGLIYTLPGGTNCGDYKMRGHFPATGGRRERNGGAECQPNGARHHHRLPPRAGSGSG